MSLPLVVDAIKSLRPGSKFSFKKDMNGNQRVEAEYLDWFDTNLPVQAPTVEEILAEVARLESEKYKQLRAAEYPPMSDLADAMYWQSQGDDSKMTAYLAAVDAVKAKYPKGVN